MTVTIVRTDGRHEVLTGVSSDQAMQIVARAINAKALDIVNLRDGRVMLVDDLGHVEGVKPVNAEATRMYHRVCVPGTTHQIVGDVAIVRDRD